MIYKLLECLRTRHLWWISSHRTKVALRWFPAMTVETSFKLLLASSKRNLKSYKRLSCKKSKKKQDLPSKKNKNKNHFRRSTSAHWTLFLTKNSKNSTLSHTKKNQNRNCYSISNSSKSTTKTLKVLALQEPFETWTRRCVLTWMTTTSSWKNKKRKI